jgi:hypothetical protein
VAPRIVFSAFLVVLTLLAYFVPYYDWDLVAYTGAAIALHERNQSAIQAQAYSALQRELPENDYRDIALGSPFRRDVATNPDHFFQQLRFYQIRPLYIRLVAVLHSAGVGSVQATRLISAACLFLLGILLFVWSRNYVPEWTAAVTIPLLLIVPIIFSAARTGSPDALSAFWVVLGIYWIVERKYFPIGAIFLLLSLFVRTDNVIFVALFLASSALTKNTPKERAVPAVLALLSLVIVFAINRTAHSYPWPVLMQNTANPIVNPAEVTPAFTAADYLSAWHDIVDEAAESSVMVFPFLATLALLSRRLIPEWRTLIKVVLLSWAAHIILFPHIEDRYFVAGAAIIGVGILVALGSRRLSMTRMSEQAGTSI